MVGFGDGQIRLDGHQERGKLEQSERGEQNVVLKSLSGFLANVLK